MKRNLYVLLRSLGGVALAMALAGCRQPESPAPELESARQEVPLRIALVGDQDQADAVQRAWLAVSDQPVQITAIAATPAGDAAADPGGTPAAQTVTDHLVDLAQQNDVLIYPAQHTGELHKADAVRRLRSQFFSTDSLSDVAVGPLLPALQQGVMQYGDEAVGVPLGAAQPVLLHPPSSRDGAERWTWEEYGQRVAALDSGQSAEPLAEGWAAVALLNRANSYCRTAWLFSGDDLRPTLATAPFLRALRELQRDAAHYPRPRMTPAEVWQAVSEGRLQLAISWPMTLENLTTAADLVVEPLPIGEEVYRGREEGWESQADNRLDEWIYLMGEAPLASIAAGCRQTAASESFLSWLSGEEGTASLRESVPMFTATRPDQAETVESSNVPSDAYAQILNTRLTNRYVRPILRIPAAEQYMQALDREVIAVLDGEKTAEAALVDASVAWEKITDAHDRRLQAKHWRLAQGLSR